MANGSMIPVNFPAAWRLTICDSKRSLDKKLTFIYDPIGSQIQIYGIRSGLFTMGVPLEVTMGVHIRVGIWISPDQSMAAK